MLWVLFLIISVGVLILIIYLKSLCTIDDLEFNTRSFSNPSGLLFFVGPQGSGKTLSAVQFIEKLTYDYPRAILCTNTTMKDINPATEVVEYTGLDCLTNLENGEYGVIYFIDEIHLEMNSLESKNISMDVIVEISQQRKQRKLIVGTSQVFMRMAKPLREQVKHVVVCKNYFKCIQVNRYIDNELSYEENGKLKSPKSKLYVWFHHPRLYNAYDTYAKMKRYKEEWNGAEHKKVDIYNLGDSPKNNIYENPNPAVVQVQPINIKGDK